MKMMNTEIQKIITRHAEEGIQLRKEFFTTCAGLLEECASRIALALGHGNKILICGNGCSAADAQHLA